MYHYVISMASATDRREHIRKEFGRHRLSFAFFDALNGEQGAQLAAQLGVSVRAGILSDGELGCLMSHTAIWQTMLAQNLPYVAVFEDDVHLSAHAPRFLQNTAWLPENAGLVKLETTKMPCLLHPKGLPLAAPFYLHRLYGNHWGTGGYIISRRTAQACLDFMRQHEILKPADDLLFTEILPAMPGVFYQLNPAICIQDSILESGNFASTIDAQRQKNRRANQNRQKKKQSLAAKARRELKRLRRQFSYRRLRLKYHQSRCSSVVVDFDPS